MCIYIYTYISIHPVISHHEWYTKVLGHLLTLPIDDLCSALSTWHDDRGCGNLRLDTGVVAEAPRKPRKTMGKP